MKIWLVRLYVMGLATLLIACAGKRVTSTTSKDELGGAVGYIAFRYDRENREWAELNVKHIETGKTYRFALSQSVSSVSAFVGPFVVYQKFLGDTVPPPLTLIPLPTGEYECRYLRLEIAHSPWMAFLMQMPSAEAIRSMKGLTFSIGTDTATYIGTFYTRAKAKFFGGIEYQAETVDDGIERAEAIGIQTNFRKTILDLD
jgi:hypothetical protein